MALGTWWLLAVMCLAILGAGVWVVAALFPRARDARAGKTSDFSADGRNEDAP
ncbi:hypothetical protein OCAE111667_16550 [Occultella aeris]|uniref:Uncharacterized protein n=1 Tax=Occultella aeris TaxID=2761496 RepID=A0A7M4DKQ9_9MICO|nr:hypothetical protein [Occultella aeris]VZO37750.1 hypothetical protein HALOF300_02723 [Occultella aeris]